MSRLYRPTPSVNWIGSDESAIRSVPLHRSAETDDATAVTYAVGDVHNHHAAPSVVGRAVGEIVSPMRVGRGVGAAVFAKQTILAYGQADPTGCALK
jgi:hypothetical protein